MFFDPTWIIILPALILSLWAQANVNSTFARFSRVSNRRSMTGYDAARRILDMNGLHNVAIEHIAGNLTDHYDPRSNTVRLSDSVYGSSSVAAIGVAAHEVGHAVQHAVGYTPIKVRNAIVPVVNLCSQLAMPLFILGLIFSSSFFMLTDVGIILFSAAVLFHIVTLPVEINASRRALSTLESSYMLEGEEISGAKKVLSAAAMTYVASAAMALLQLLRLIAIRDRRR
ncbi:MAG: zinc metallopeptidase [Clostridia bacterium]|nr:zinc metallopeptidase [Clostridia bacterium]